MRNRRPRRVAHLHRDAAEDRRREHRGDGAERRAQHAAGPDDARLSAGDEGDERHRHTVSDEDRREIPVAHLDDQIRPAERRKPVAVALWPVVAASHARPGDAHDRAEHEVQTRDDQRRRSTAGERPSLQAVAHDRRASPEPRASRAR